MPVLLTYAMNPTQAFAGLQTSFTLTAANPSDGKAITLQPNGLQGDGIQVTFSTGATGLIDTVDFTATASGVFQAQRTDGPTFFIYPTGNTTLQPGEQIKVVFNPVTVDGTAGPATVTINEYIGTNSGALTLPVQKKAQELNIIAWLDPYLVGLGETSTMHWQSYAGTKVQIINFPDGPGTKSFPVQGDPPYPGSTTVYLTPTESERIYTAVVTTDDGRHRETPVNLAHHGPVISFPAGGSTVTAGPAENVPLTWTTLFAPRVYLQSSVGGAPKLVASNPLTPVMVTPGADAFNSAADWQSIPGAVAYTLVATGYGNDAQSAPIQIDIGPVKALYLKYLKKDKDGKLSEITFATDPASWAASQLEYTDNGATFAVYQPGGKVTTLYLGSSDTVHPQVQYFEAAAKTGGSYTLSWVTANVTKLVLGPDGYTVPPADIAKGSHDVKPSATTDYVLTATSQSNETVTSTLTVTV